MIAGGYDERVLENREYFVELQELAAVRCHATFPRVEVEH